MRMKTYNQANAKRNLRKFWLSGIRSFTYSGPISLDNEIERYEIISSYLADRENKDRLNETNNKYANQIASKLVDIWIDKTLPEETREKSHKLLETIFQNCLSYRE